MSLYRSGVARVGKNQARRYCVIASIANFSVGERISPRRSNKSRDYLAYRYARASHEFAPAASGMLPVCTVWPR